MKIEVAGENALIIYFGDDIHPSVSSRVHQAVTLVEQALGDWLIDLVPSYASLLVIYDAQKCDHLRVRQRLGPALSDITTESAEPVNLVTLPVWYSVESGPDLEALAQRSELSINEVIALHSTTEYRVYAIGFAPGFAYLGEVDPRIAAPRLRTPRASVPRGTVAIAERQTAVYPATSPGGWNLIGRCPIPMFDPTRSPSMPVQVGDRVRFTPVDRDTYIELGGDR